MKQIGRVLSVVLLGVGMGGVATQAKAAPREQPAKRATLRVPAHAEMNRMVNLKGKKIPLREAIAQIDPEEKVKLRNGKEVSIQSVIDAFVELENQNNIRLSAIVKRVPMPSATRAKLEDSRGRLKAHAEDRRAQEAAGWRSIISKTRGGRKFRPQDLERSGGDQQELPLGSFAVGSQDFGVDSLATQAQPKTEPAEFVWEDDWGHRELAAAFLAFGVGNDFIYKSGSATVSCAAKSSAGIYLFNKQLPVTRVVAGAAASSTAIEGGIRLFVLSDSVPKWKQEGKFNFPKKELSFQTPEAGVPVPIIGPLSLNVAVLGKAIASFSATIDPKLEKGKYFSCSATALPAVRVSGKGGATLKFSNLAQKIIEVIAGSFSAGLDADMKLLDLGLPITLGLKADLDQKNPSNFLGLSQQLSASFNASMLAGSLTGWLDLDMSWWLEIVAAAFGIKDGHHERELFSWPGENHNYKLVNVSGSIPLSKP